jgi:uncharacterized protein YukE
MAAEMPAQVQPVDGAEVVDFPWASASSAVSALNAASSTLGSQLGARPGMLDTLNDWVGSYRDEFDPAYRRISSTASGLKETMATLASNIVSGAEDANARQSTLNRQAENEPAGAN